MSMIDDLIGGASFRGVPFHIERAGLVGGRRIVNHEYPERDESDNQDLGSKSRKFSLTCFVIGKDWKEQSNTFLNALDQKGAGTLIHPWFEPISAIAHSFEASIDKNEIGVVRFTVQFIEDHEKVTPSASRSSSYFAEDSILSASEVTVTDFINEFSISGFPDFVAESSLTKIKEITAIIGSNTIETDLTNSDSLARSIMGEINHDFNVNRLSAVASPYFETPARLQESKNLNSLNALVRRSQLLDLTSNYLTTDFEVIEEAEAANLKIQEMVDAEVLATRNTEIVRSFSSMRINTIKAISENSIDAKRLIPKHYNGNRSSLVEAYDLYEDANRAGEISKRNKATHPSFLSGSFKVLSS